MPCRWQNERILPTMPAPIQNSASDVPPGRKVISPPPSAPEPWNDAPSPPSQPPIALNQPARPRSRLWMWLLATLALLVLVVVGSWLGNTYWRASGDDSPKTAHQSATGLKNQRLLVVGINRDNRPMAFSDPLSGHLAGYNVDLALAIAEELGVEVEFVEASSRDYFAAQASGLGNDLSSSRLDLIMDNISVATRHKGPYLFSQPYLSTKLVAVTRQEWPPIKGPNDLLTARVVQSSDLERDGLPTSWPALPQVQTVSTATDGATKLVNNEADVLLTDLISAKALLKAGYALNISEDLSSLQYAAIVSQNGTPIQMRVNAILTDLSGRGVLQSLEQKWLN